MLGSSIYMFHVNTDCLLPRYIPYLDQANHRGLNGLKIIIKETKFIEFVFRFFPFANMIFNIQFIFEFPLKKAGNTKLFLLYNFYW